MFPRRMVGGFIERTARSNHQKNLKGNLMDITRTLQGRDKGRIVSSCCSFMIFDGRICDVISHSNLMSALLMSTCILITKSLAGSIFNMSHPLSLNQCCSLEENYHQLRLQIIIVHQHHTSYQFAVSITSVISFTISHDVVRLVNLKEQTHKDNFFVHFWHSIQYKL